MYAVAKEGAQVVLSDLDQEACDWHAAPMMRAGRVAEIARTAGTA